jgi:DnaK suppressor protein
MPRQSIEEAMGAKTTTAKTAEKAKPAAAAKKATPAKKAAPIAAAEAAAERAPEKIAKVSAVPAEKSSRKGSDHVLSEAEILAAPEKDYMNPAQLHFFKLRLQKMEQDILRNAGETTEHLRESIIVPDPADRATIEEEHALELRTRDRERKLLKKIQQSITRIDSGDYGYCEETGDPIGVPRLLARPTATLSLEAQERREMKQKMFGE